MQDITSVVGKIKGMERKIIIVHGQDEQVFEMMIDQLQDELGSGLVSIPYDYFKEGNSTLWLESKSKAERQKVFKAKFFIMEESRGFNFEPAQLKELVEGEYFQTFVPGVYDYDNEIPPINPCNIIIMTARDPHKYLWEDLETALKARTVVIPTSKIAVY